MAGELIGKPVLRLPSLYTSLCIPMKVSVCSQSLFSLVELWLSAAPTFPAIQSCRTKRLKNAFVPAVFTVLWQSLYLSQPCCSGMKLVFYVVVCMSRGVNYQHVRHSTLDRKWINSNFDNWVIVYAQFIYQENLLAHFLKFQDWLPLNHSKFNIHGF